MNAKKRNEQLITVTVQARLLFSEGRSRISARSHHSVVDAPGALGGPNETIHLVEQMLSSLASCSVLVCEHVALEQNITLVDATADVEGSLNLRGVRGEDIDPGIQRIRVKLVLTGPTMDQGDMLVKAIKTRCPVYATLERAASIEFELTMYSI